VKLAVETNFMPRWHVVDLQQPFLVARICHVACALLVTEHNRTGGGAPPPPPPRGGGGGRYKWIPLNGTRPHHNGFSVAF
jgi:hypothetical protein